MKSDSMNNGREALENWIENVYGNTHTEPVAKADFLHVLWNAVADLVHYNKHNPLMQAAVRQYPDLIPRIFTIVSVLYGSFTCEPKKLDLLKEAAGLIGKDLVEVEIKGAAYAKGTSGKRFFPELAKVLEMVHEVYGAKHFRLEALPPTPYQAYAVFVLNHASLIEKEMSLEELFGHLSVSDSKMRTVLSLVSSSAPPTKTGPTDGQTRH